MRPFSFPLLREKLMGVWRTMWEVEYFGVVSLLKKFCWDISSALSSGCIREGK